MPVPARRIVPETLIAAFVAAASALMASGYLLDAIGVAIHPVVLGIAAIAAAVAAFVAIREPAGARPDPSTGSGSSRASSRDERAAASRGLPVASLLLFGLVVAVALGYFVWLTWPSLLPVTIGPDIVHHLQLIHVIHRTQHLANDPALGPYLLEMMNYTPGSHIAAATLGHWARLDPLRVLFPLTALFVAVKIGIVYMLAVRLVAEKPGAAVYALAAPVLLMIPAPYVLGSFFEFFYFAQVLSETFAVGMVIAAVSWTRTGERRHLWLAAACGIGVFLSWPMWIPPAGAAVLTAVALDRAPMRARILSAAIVVLPVAAIGLLHASTHAAGASIIGSSGAVTQPSAETLGVAFVALGVFGAILALWSTPWRSERVIASGEASPERAIAGRQASSQPVIAGRGIAVLFLFTIVQALALAAFDARAGARSFYMPFKMVYLIVLPCAVLGALALATMCDAVASRIPRVRMAAAVVPLMIAAWLAAGRLPVKRPRSPISESALAAGLWAKATLPAGCIDYFSRHWLTGYWLHLDVLGNPRLSDRMRAETFEFRDTVGKWIRGKGLPYGIVEDLAEIPRDARVDMIPVREFGRSALVKNTRPAPAAACDRGLTPR